MQLPSPNQDTISRVAFAPLNSFAPGSREYVIAASSWDGEVWNLCKEGVWSLQLQFLTAQFQRQFLPSRYLVNCVLTALLLIVLLFVVSVACVASQGCVEPGSADHND